MLSKKTIARLFIFALPLGFSACSADSEFTFTEQSSGIFSAEESDPALENKADLEEAPQELGRGVNSQATGVQLVDATVLDDHQEAIGIEQGVITPFVEPTSTLPESNLTEEEAPEEVVEEPQVALNPMNPNIIIAPDNLALTPPAQYIPVDNNNPFGYQDPNVYYIPNPNNLNVSNVISEDKIVGYPEDEEVILPTFGYRALKKADVRPVIIVPIAYSDEPIDIDLDTIDRYTFGPSDGMNASDYIDTVSLGQAGLRRIALLPTRTLSKRRSENTSDLERGEAVQQALDQGIDLMSFDVNRDGVLTEREVLILSIVADPVGVGGGGAGRVCCGQHTSSDGYRKANFCGWTPSFSEHAGAGVITHEILHMFGAGDMYSIAESGIHTGMTIMSTPNTTYIDPYFRIKNGWVPPHVVDIAPFRNLYAVQCLTLPALYTTDETYKGPVVFYDSESSRGEHEYLMGELRLRGGMDADIYEEGFSFWYALENNAGALQGIAVALLRGTGAMAMNEVQGDDNVITSWADGQPYLTTPGLNGVIDTPISSPDRLLYATPVHYPAPHLAPSVRTGPANDRLLGFPKLWNNMENPIMDIIWPDPAKLNGGPRDSGISVRFGKLPTDGSGKASLEIGRTSLIRSRQASGRKICQ